MPPPWQIQISLETHTHTHTPFGKHFWFRSWKTYWQYIFNYSSHKSWVLKSFDLCGSILRLYRFIFQIMISGEVIGPKWGQGEFFHSKIKRKAVKSLLLKNYRPENLFRLWKHSFSGSVDLGLFKSSIPGGRVRPQWGVKFLYRKI